MDYHHQVRQLFFKNPYPGFPEFEGDEKAEKAVQLLRADHHTIKDCRQHVVSNLTVILSSQPPEPSSRHRSVYTGRGGLAMLYWHAYELSKAGEHLPGFPSERLLTMARDYIDSCLARATPVDVSTFLLGDVGIYALAAVIYGELNLPNESLKMLKEIEDLSYLARYDPQASVDTLNELLYGRTGYLHALLWIYSRRHHVPWLDSSQWLKLIARVFTDTINSCVAQSREAASRGGPKTARRLPPLLVTFHNKPYLGAAHGLAGVLYTLMETVQMTHALDGAVTQDQMDLIWESVEYLLGTATSTGNYLTTIDSTEDVLVQFCHGAPGVVLALVKAAEVFPQHASRLIAACYLSASCIWERGLLTKSRGLCHGTTGNAYAFLALYRQLNNDSFYLAALAFTRQVLHQDKSATREPDHPFSLFEGLAGETYFYLDMLQPKQSAFPGFELHNLRPVPMEQRAAMHVG